MKGRLGREARAAGQALDATLFVGAGGVTDAVAAEAAAQLKTRDLVKAKVARQAADASSMREVGAELAARAKAELVEVRGRTVLLARPGGLRLADAAQPPRGPRRRGAACGRQERR